MLFGQSPFWSEDEAEREQLLTDPSITYEKTHQQSKSASEAEACLIDTEGIFNNLSYDCKNILGLMLEKD